MTEEAVVELTLKDAKTGEPTIYRLTPKISAMRALNRYAGGYTGMFKAIQGYDADAMAFVIVAGTGAVGNPAKVIEERVYATGLGDLLPPLVRFINICSNGGREPADTPAAGDGAAPGNV